MSGSFLFLLGVGECSFEIKFCLGVGVVLIGILSGLFFIKGIFFLLIFTPQPLRAVGVLFSPMVSRWAGGRREKVSSGCISETVRCRKLILGRDIG